MAKQDSLVGGRLLLMGSKIFKAAELPPQVVEKIGEATAPKMMVIVGEVPGACKPY